MSGGKAAYVAGDEGAVEVRGESEKFIGLSKEELEEYRHAPFWRNLRYLLFGLFWLAWIAMFAAAIAIVFTSPPCPPKEIPHWWQNKLSYQIFTPSFKDSDADGLGDIEGVSDELASLQRLDISTVWPRPLLAAKDGSFALEDVTDHTAANERLGSTDALNDLVGSTKGYSQRFVMDFPLATSDEHVWFTASAKKDPGFEEVYDWSRSKKSPSSEWSRDSERKEYYRHLPNKKQNPVLNLDSAEGLGKVNETLVYWIEKGVDGFFFANIEAIARSGSKPNWAKAAQLLANLNAAIQTYKNESGNAEEEFAFFGGVDADVSAADEKRLISEGKLNYLYKPSLSQLSWKGEGGSGLTNCREKVTCIADLLDKVETEGVDNLFELGNSQSPRLADRFGPKRAALMEMLLLSLPGAVSHYYGDELPLGGAETAGLKDGFEAQHGVMQWSSEANAGFSTAAQGALKAPQPNADYMSNNFQDLGWGPTLRKLFSRLAGLRKRDETMLVGSFERVKTPTDKGQAIITIRRPKEGKSGYVYVTVLNFDARKMTKQDLTKANLVNEGVSVVAATNGTDYAPRTDADLSAVSLPPMSGVVLRYKHEAPPPPEEAADPATAEEKAQEKLLLRR